MRHFNEITVLKSNSLKLVPGGLYNLNEGNETERRVVKLHMLKVFADLCAEDVSNMGENHVELGSEIEAIADKLFELYRPNIEKGHDVFEHKDFFRAGKLGAYDRLFETFRATGRDVSNVAEYVEDYDGPGRMYMEDLYIGSTELWPEEHNARGNKWYLQIGNLEWLSNDLEFLEYELFKFALYMGYLDNEEV